jgi:hypothetical protein
VALLVAAEDEREPDMETLGGRLPELFRFANCSMLHK